MFPTARRAGSIAAVAACLLVPALAHGQTTLPGTSVTDVPALRDSFPGAGGGRSTPTPEPTATVTAEPTATATATPVSTATPGGKDPSELARTGSDPLPLALGGLSLIGFGLALRLRIALDDARRQHPFG